MYHNMYCMVMRTFLQGPQGDVGRQGLGGQKGMKGDSVGYLQKMKCMNLTYSYIICDWHFRG